LTDPATTGIVHAKARTHETPSVSSWRSSHSGPPPALTSIGLFLSTRVPGFLWPGDRTFSPAQGAGSFAPLQPFGRIEAEDLDAALAWASKVTAGIKAPIESVPSRMNPSPDSVRDVDAVPKLDEAEVGRIFREESGRSVAALIRVFGDIDIAEDAVQEAFAVALRKWPRRPAAHPGAAGS
jgi:hypothetical protein